MSDTRTETPADGCTVELLGRDELCEEPVAVAYVAGCVGEHLEEGRYCERHAASLLDGALLCNACWRLGQRVRVAALGRVLPSGERVRVDLFNKIGSGSDGTAVVSPGGDGPRSGPGTPLTHPGADPLPV